MTALSSGTASTQLDGVEAGAGVFQLADFDDVVFVAVFDDPVVAGQAAVDDAVDDVAADFLRAKEHGGDLVIVDARKDAAIGS